MRDKYSIIIVYSIFMLVIGFMWEVSNGSEIDLTVKLNKLKVVYTKEFISDLKHGLSLCSVDDNLVLSIIMVESSFKVDAVNKHSYDYGLMQINEWHVKHSRLDREKLISDVKYNIDKGCDILSWFVKRYDLETAIRRYNCGTRKGCVNLKSVKRYSRKVLQYKNLLDGSEK